MYQLVHTVEGKEIPFFHDPKRMYRNRHRAESQAMRQEYLYGKVFNQRLDIRIREVEIDDDIKTLKAKLFRAEEILKKLLVDPNDLSGVAGYVMDHCLKHPGDKH